MDSFGNATRIDYGTGHEKTFCMFVCGLFKIGFLVDEDRLSVGLKLFSKYFNLGEYPKHTYYISVVFNSCGTGPDGGKT